MKLNEFCNKTLTDFLENMNISDIQFESSESGEIKAIEIRYVPKIVGCSEKSKGLKLLS